MELFTEYLKEPVALMSTLPDSAGFVGFVQTAYRSGAASGGEPDGSDVLCWDSGRVDSGEVLGIRYAGSALEPDRRYTWPGAPIWRAGRDGGGRLLFPDGYAGGKLARLLDDDAARRAKCRTWTAVLCCAGHSP